MLLYVHRSGGRGGCLGGVGLVGWGGVGEVGGGGGGVKRERVSCSTARSDPERPRKP